MLITGGTYAYYALTASNNSIAGTAGEADLSLEVVNQHPNNEEYLVPQLEKGLATAISSNYNCVDDNNNTVCQVYSIKITNTGTATVKINGTITFGNIDKMPNLKWRLIQDKNTYGKYSSHYASLDDARFDSDLTLRKGASKTYYMVIWIDEVDKNQPDTGKYNATIDFSSSNGTGVTSTVGEFNYMKNISADTFRSDEYREKIKNVSFVDYIDTSNAVVQWDASELGDNSIVAWLNNNSSDGYYDLYIGSKKEIYAKDLSKFFQNMTKVDSISFDNLNTIQTTTMRDMFRELGSSSSVFVLNLGNKFDTRNVIYMNGMFYNTGKNDSVFTLDLGDKFNTKNVKNMDMMFWSTGNVSDVFTLDLGDRFDTSSVTNMERMFAGTGNNAKNFTLNLGDKFDTHNVINMFYFFNGCGTNSEVFSLDLGSKFDTSNVTDMWGMFSGCGTNSKVFQLNLGDKFNTSNVKNMANMFANVGKNSSNFTLDLGDKFDTSNVTNMEYMFKEVGYSSRNFTFDLGDKFDTSNVTKMRWMFFQTGFNSENFSLKLNDKFDTSNVTDVTYMFSGTGYESDNLVLDLTGFDFNTVNSYNDFIKTKKTPTIYVKSEVEKNWILDKNFTGVSSSNIIVKS